MGKPLASTGQVGIDHPHIDARSLDMARIVVERIDADPSLFNVARENLERWRRLHGTLSRANEEWEQILNCPGTKNGLRTEIPSAARSNDQRFTSRAAVPMPIRPHHPRT